MHKVSGTYAGGGWISFCSYCRFFVDENLHFWENITLNPEKFFKKWINSYSRQISNFLDKTESFSSQIYFSVCSSNSLPPCTNLIFQRRSHLLLLLTVSQILRISLRLHPKNKGVIEKKRCVKILCRKKNKPNTLYSENGKLFLFWSALTLG